MSAANMLQRLRDMEARVKLEVDRRVRSAFAEYGLDELLFHDDRRVRRLLVALSHALEDSGHTCARCGGDSRGWICERCDGTYLDDEDW